MNKIEIRERLQQRIAETVQSIDEQKLSREALTRLAALAAILGAEQEKTIDRQDSTVARLCEALREKIDTVVGFNTALEALPSKGNDVSAEVLENNPILKRLIKAIKQRDSQSAKLAVSAREDQRAKKAWLIHCQSVKDSGIKVDKIDDLLDLAKYDPQFVAITPKTLKAWAKGLGLEFKAGRPRK